MSFQEKMTAIMARPGQDPVPKDDVPWWMKFAGRALGTMGGFFAMLFGLFILISLSPTTILAGMWQILAGFILLCCEAPCCCIFVDHVQKLADVVESRPYWNRAAVYICISLPPIIMALGLGSLMGSGLIFTTGIIYGMMALGRKATVEEMRQAAAAQDGAVRPPPANNMRSNLVANAQPISFTGAPVFDSNV